MKVGLKMKKIIAFLVLSSVLVLAIQHFSKNDNKIFEGEDISTEEQILIEEDNIVVKEKKIEIQEEFLMVDIIYPVFSGFNSANELNEEIEYKIQLSLNEAKDAESYNTEERFDNSEEDLESFKIIVSLETDYEYAIVGELLSLRLNTYYYSGGAHPIYWIDSLNINTKTGETILFEDIFKDKNASLNFINEEILSEIDKDKDSYFEGYEEYINDLNGDLQYYFEEDELVVYFGLYEITAYAYGMPEFRFELDKIKGIINNIIN